ncbi:hypothetical protein ACDT10_18050 [Mycobacterium intracellulare]|uniref:Serine/threonine protein kinase n=2 Tax=Mycobacterium avium complex (MAC) TaxID=120793 RepID=A0ABN5ZT29_9MYCO|nr:MULTISPECIES: hypothetical protein [Mycobacterium]MDO2361137.1 hypothetical protein [Mycobacterium avium subsp. hominissuis]BBY10905.1 hypothetical protein MMARJ_16450 [Mycobacterium marseillense]GFG97731.1 hypothetical protein MTIM_36100 [Mycobacterium timonense]
MARYESPNNGGDDQISYTNLGQSLNQPRLTPWYRRRVVLLGAVLAILIALITWGIVALFTGSQGGSPSITTTTTTTAPATSTSGGFRLPSLPSEITLPSLPSKITLPSEITLPSLP